MPGSKLIKLQLKHPSVLIYMVLHTGQQVLFDDKTLNRAIIVNGYHTVRYFDKN